jgi:hypothetical protein
MWGITSHHELYGLSMFKPAEILTADQATGLAQAKASY